MRVAAGGRGSAAGARASQATASSRGASSRIRPSSRKTTRSAQRERPRRPLLGEHDGGAAARRRARGSASAASGSSCEVGSSSSSSRGRERERGGEADALELAAGELGVRRPARCAAPTAASAASRPRPDLRRRRAEVLEPERDLVLDERRARPGPPDPGTPWRPCPASSAGRARACPARRPRRGRRSARRGSAGRARRARAGASTCPSPRGRAARRPRPARAAARRRASAGAPRPDTRTPAARRGLEPQRPRDDEQRRRRRGRPGRAHVHGGRGARVRPARPKPRASIASARFDARSSEPATSGESSRAWPRTPATATPARAPPRRARRRRARASGTSRVASATASAERRANRGRATSRSWSSRSAYAENASADAASRSAWNAALWSSSVGHVERPEHRHDRPFPDHVHSGRLQERPDQEHPERGGAGSEEVRANPRLRLKDENEQRCREERERQRRDPLGAPPPRRPQAGPPRGPAQALLRVWRYRGALFFQLWRSHHSTSPASSFTSAAPFSQASRSRSRARRFLVRRPAPRLRWRSRVAGVALDVGNRSSERMAVSPALPGLGR